MGKMVSIYLTDEEQRLLKKFCEDNQCTQYAAMKTGIQELLSKHVVETGEATKAPIKENSDVDEQEPSKAKDHDILRMILKGLKE